MPTKTHVIPSHIEEVMTPDPVRVSGGTPARELARIFEANEISGVPVVDALDRVIGVVSKTDLLHRCVQGPLGSQPGSILTQALADEVDFEAVEELGSADELMSSGPVTARPGDALTDVARRMAEERVHRVVIVDEERHALGIVTSLDLVKAFAG